MSINVIAYLSALVDERRELAKVDVSDVQRIAEYAAANEARAVMAELIEAGNEWCALMPGLAGGPEFDRLVTALARTGSAS